nr:hypothetical protein [Bacteroidota bacterium]
MRISHKYRFIFISKPRCASTTIRNILDPFSDITSSATPPFHHHATALELKLYFDRTGWNWKDYFVFTTVRNPWDMIVSYYIRFKPDVNGLYNFEKERDGCIYMPDNPASFKEWVLSAKTYHRVLFSNETFQKNVWVDGFSKLTLANTVNDHNGNSLANKVLKVESLDNTLSGTLQELGILITPKIVRMNTTGRIGYRAYFDDETRRIIEKEFISDIKFGHYTF